jgi:tetratricopeptide (TPR) repeat protein
VAPDPPAAAAPPILFHGPRDLPRFGPEPPPASRRAGRSSRRSAVASADRRKVQLDEAWQLYRAQRFEDARTLFTRLAGKRAPGGVYLGLGKVAFQKQQYAEAATRAREAVKRGAGLDALILLGDAHFRMQQYREAQKAYREALKTNPSHEPAQRALRLAEQRLQ